MNPLALLTILFGTAAIILAYALLALRNDNKHLRTVIGTVPPSQASIDLQGAALDLVTECQLLEQRNDWLESRHDHCKDIIAASMAQSRLPRRDTTRMEVAETGRMP